MEDFRNNDPSMLVEYELSFIKENKKTFYESAHNAKSKAFQLKNTLPASLRAELEPIIECLTDYEAVLESV